MVWRSLSKRVIGAVGMAAVVGLAVVPAMAQPAGSPAVPAPETVAGVYEGTAVGPDGGAMALRVELKYANGQFTGSIDAPSAQVSILGGRLEGDALTLTIDAGGLTGGMVGKVVAGRIEGTWTLGDMGGGFAVAKLDTPAGPGSEADPISGVWVGEVNVQGQPMPFTLTLKLNGGSVAGDVESAMGKVPLTGGEWKDGTLTITFPYVGGEPVSMGAQLKGGRLEGIVDYNTGELQGTWTASKK